MRVSAFSCICQLFKQIGMVLLALEYGENVRQYLATKTYIMNKHLNGYNCLVRNRLCQLFFFFVLKVRVGTGAILSRDRLYYFRVEGPEDKGIVFGSFRELESGIHQPSDFYRRIGINRRNKSEYCE